MRWSNRILFVFSFVYDCLVFDLAISSISRKVTNCQIKISTVEEKTVVRPEEAKVEENQHQENRQKLVSIKCRKISILFVDSTHLWNILYSRSISHCCLQFIFLYIVTNYTLCYPLNKRLTKKYSYECDFSSFNFFLE